MPLLVPDVEPVPVVADADDPAVAADWLDVLVEGYVEGEVVVPLVPLVPAVPEPVAEPDVVPVAEPVVADEVVSLLAPLRLVVELEDGAVEEEPEELLLGGVDFGCV